MLSTGVLMAWEYAHTDVAKQGFGIIRTTKTCKTRGLVLFERGVLLENMRKPLCFMVKFQQGSVFTGICSLSHTSIKTQNPDSRGFLLCFVSELWISGVEDGNNGNKAYTNSGFGLARVQSSTSVHHEKPCVSCRIRSREAS